jgi:hypothetical protein
MLGLGKGLDEVRGVLADLKEAGCSYDYAIGESQPRTISPRDRLF